MTTLEWMHTVQELAMCNIAHAYFEETGVEVYYGTLENYCSCGGTISFRIVSGNLHMWCKCDTCDFGFIQ